MKLNMTKVVFVALCIATAIGFTYSVTKKAHADDGEVVQFARYEIFPGDPATFSFSRSTVRDWHGVTMVLVVAHFDKPYDIGLGMIQSKMSWYSIDCPYGRVMEDRINFLDKNGKILNAAPGSHGWEYITGGGVDYDLAKKVC